MSRVLSLLLLLLLLGQSLSSEGYLITVDQKKELDEIFQNQENSITELKKELEDQEKELEDQEIELEEAERQLESSIIATLEAEKSLEKLKTKSWTDSLLKFFAGLGAGIILKSTYDFVNK